MDTWYKFKKKDFKIDLNAVDVPKQICYANYLISHIAWLATNNKLKQKHVDKFFNVASLILQATIAQKGFKKNELTEIFTYIDTIAKDLVNSDNSNVDLGLMLGNLSELEDAHYTFTELIGFIRAFSVKI